MRKSNNNSRASKERQPCSEYGNRFVNEVKMINADDIVDRFFYGTDTIDNRNACSKMEFTNIEDKLLVELFYIFNNDWDAMAFVLHKKANRIRERFDIKLKMRYLFETTIRRKLINVQYLSGVLYDIMCMYTVLDQDERLAVKGLIKILDLKSRDK